MAEQDPYRVLGVERSATQEEIRTAYRRLARQHHPDVNPQDSQAEERFKQITAAYQVIGDPAKREQFDRFGTTEIPTQGDFFQGAGRVDNVGDIFDMFFGNFGGGNRSANLRGDDIETTLEVDLLEVLHGATRKVKVRRHKHCGACGGSGVEGGGPAPACTNCNGTGRVATQFLGAMQMMTVCPVCRGSGVHIPNPCKTCSGSGVENEQAEIEIKVPPGVDNDVTLRLQSAGNAGRSGFPHGDLFVKMRVKPQKGVRRKGKTLEMDLDITFTQAALGETLEVELLDERWSVEVPPGTQPNQKITVKGAGLPAVNNGVRGNLVLNVVLEVPKRLSEAEAEHLRKFAEMRGEVVPKGGKQGGIFESLFKKR